VCCRQAVRDAGIASVAVVLKHAYIFGKHEEAVGALARELGFTQVICRWCPMAQAEHLEHSALGLSCSYHVCSPQSAVLGESSQTRLDG